MDIYINLGEVRPSPDGLQMSVIVNGYDQRTGETISLGTVYRVDFTLSDEANRAMALVLGQEIAMAAMDQPYVLQLQGPRARDEVLPILSPRQLSPRGGS